MNESLQSELVTVLRHRENERLDIILNGQNYEQHLARFSDLGVLFSRFQRLYTSIAQAITSGPTLRGPISSVVRSATDLRLKATFASSFGMEVYVPSSYDLLGKSLSSDALEQLFQLLRASMTEQQLMPISGVIGRRALGHLRSLASLFSETDSDIKIDWKDFTGTKYQWHANKENSNNIIRAIDNIKQNSSETKNISGMLVGASLLRNRFEMVLDNGSVIEGKFIAGLSSEIRGMFGNRIAAVVDETEITDQASSETKVYYTLKSVTNPGPSAPS